MSNKITKKDIAATVGAKNELPTSVSEAVVTDVFDTIGDHMKSGDQVDIYGFGSFRSVHREARKGRNPATGEAMDIPAKDVPQFKPSQRLKDLLTK